MKLGVAWSRTVYLPAESSDLFLIIGCMTSNLLYLSFSTLYSSSSWRTDTIVFAKLNKRPPPPPLHKRASSQLSPPPPPTTTPPQICLKKISPLGLRIYGKCKGENVQEYGYKQTHLFWLTLRQRSNGSQALDKESREEMLLSSSLSSLNKTQFVSWGGCKRRDRKRFGNKRITNLTRAPMRWTFQGISVVVQFYPWFKFYFSLF